MFGKGAGRSENAAKILNGKRAFWLEGGYQGWPFVSSKDAAIDDPLIFHQILFLFLVPISKDGLSQAPACSNSFSLDFASS